MAQSEPEPGLLDKNEDIVILKEKIKYDFIGVYTLSLNLVVDKEIEYKILTPAGIEKLRQITLPEPIDETYFIHSTAVRNLNHLPENSSVLSFSGEISSPGKPVARINDSPKLVRTRVLTDDGSFGLLGTYSIAIPGLKVGDIVRISYRLNIPFRDNYYALTLSRFYFHQKSPLKSLDFSFSYDKALPADVTFTNNCDVVPTLKDNYNTYTWHFDNLPGCLDELGSRPYIDLPWFSFHPKMNETLIFNRTTRESNYIQPWYIMAGAKEGGIDGYLQEYKQGIKNKDNSGFDKTALRFNNPKTDSIHSTRLWRFQKWMADSTKYNPDTAYYLNEENHLTSKPGVDLNNGLIRDHNIDDVYGALLPRLGYSFMNAYLVDKRVGTVSPTYFASLHDNDVLFGVPLNHAISFLIPASYRNHYYFEELPFYYEETPAILIYPSNFKVMNTNFRDSTRIVTTPGSAFSENLRNMSCMVDVNITAMSLAFSSRLILSGQYSTLTRSVYLGQLPDRTINPLYLKKLSEIGGNDRPGSFTITGNEYAFPYKTTVKGNYVSKALKKENDSIYVIDVADWLIHIIYPELQAENRITDFYPDFAGSDKYFYMLAFDKDIELVDVPQEIKIQNSMGSYVFNLVQNDKNKVLITSFFVTGNKMIPAAAINDVAGIYNAIKSRKEFKIRFKVKG